MRHPLTRKIGAALVTAVLLGNPSAWAQPLITIKAEIVSLNAAKSEGEFKLESGSTEKFSFAQGDPFYVDDRYSPLSTFKKGDKVTLRYSTGTAGNWNARMYKSSAPAAPAKKN